MRMVIDGWFFDVYPVRNGVVVWILDSEGHARPFFDAFQPAFYLRLDPHDERRLPALAAKLRLPVSVGEDRKTELFSGEEWRVTKITVTDPLRLNDCVRSLQKFFPHFAFYNSNIPVAQMYLYDRQVFPLARCEFITAGGGDSLLQIVVEDSFEACDYRVPDLRIMQLRNVSSRQTTKFFRTLTLELQYDGTTHLLEQEQPRDIIETLNWHLYHYDPDVIVTSWGDATLFPTLLRAARQNRLPLLLSRDQTQTYFTTQERSYWTYGEVIHRDAAIMLAGR